MQKNIILKTFRQAAMTDWDEFLDENSWLALTTVEVRDLSAYVRSNEPPDMVKVPLDATLQHDEVTVESIFQRWWQDHSKSPVVGPFKIALSVREVPEFSVRIKGRICKIREILFEGNVVATKYPINLTALKGHILERQGTDCVFRCYVDLGIAPAMPSTGLCRADVTDLFRERVDESFQSA
ncbi:MAG: hypothetical protein ACREDR_30905 [Blastocatellia bacterium]